LANTGFRDAQYKLLLEPLIIIIIIKYIYIAQDREKLQMRW